MGCDIHWWSETRKDSVWVCDQKDSFYVDTQQNNYTDMNEFISFIRDYAMFGLLQDGVRSSWEWSFKHFRGFPQDASSQVKAMYAYWGEDAHSPGWLTRAELKAKRHELLARKIQELIHPTGVMWMLSRHINNLDDILELLNAPVEDTEQRIVFFFDN